LKNKQVGGLLGKTLSAHNFFVRQPRVSVSVSFYVKISRKTRWCGRFFDISKTNRVRP